MDFEDKITVYIASDSTVQTFAEESAPQQGWGQHFYRFFPQLQSVRRDTRASYEQATLYDCGPVRISNRAIGGRSSRSFVEEGKLEEIAEVISEGDLLLIQWGHNDATECRPNRYVAPENFADWIKKYIDLAEEKNAQIVLITPVARYSYDEKDRSFKEDFVSYTYAMLELASEEDLPVVDLSRASVEFLNAQGPEAAQRYFMISEAGSEDRTHLNAVGARAFARLVAEGLMDLPYGKWALLDELRKYMTLQGGAEHLRSRAAVAMDLSGRKGAEIKEGKETGVFLSWRRFPGEEDVCFSLYKNGELFLEDYEKSNFWDPEGTAEDRWRIVGSTDARLGLEAREIAVWQDHYIDFPIQKPAPLALPDGQKVSFTPNDISAADLDGDGELEIVLKWACNDKDNAHKGLTGPVYLDGYDLDYNTGDCRLLWRINLSVNIRAGAHYTQFQLFDYNGDGKAELILKTADGSTTYRSEDGTQDTLRRTGFVGACSAEELPYDRFSAQHDYRNKDGFILEGPEYLTVFAGEDGRILDTVEYEPLRGASEDWGDPDGNRVDRFLAATAYLNGTDPMAVFCRGYYTRTVLAAYRMKDTDGDGIGDKLERYWLFDSAKEQVNYPEFELEGQGNHSMAVADVDGDGKDEIIYGSLVLDDDGTVLYCTNLGHGDAMHVSDWDWNNPGLEILQVHESSESAYGIEMHDAATGKILHGFYSGHDTGRGAAGDIDPTAFGAEFWCGDKPGGENPGGGEWDSTTGGVYSTDSSLEELVMLSPHNPAANFTLYWDGDLLPEIQDHAFYEPDYYPIAGRINKWDYLAHEEKRLFESTELLTNNGTKGNMGLVADLVGDWRDEFIGRTADGNALRLYSTNYETPYSFPTPLKDRQYRLGIAWQNTAYNQPTHRSYALSEGLITSALSLVKADAEEGIEISYTEASDGKYGLPVKGYLVSRAEGEEDFSEFMRLDGKEAGHFTDHDVESGKTYRYQIQAVLEDEKALPSQERMIVSYKSQPLEVEL